jgi:RsiW-degrading membrane proteinase PrsW (M82 family)
MCNCLVCCFNQETASVFLVQGIFLSISFLKIIKMNIKRAVLSAVIIWTLGVCVYTGSFFFEWMEDPEFQANLLLTLAVIPITVFGAYFYYRKRDKTNGFKLGIFMFIIAMALDALITVPLFIIPGGGTHLTFFTDPGFWLIAVEYILAIGLYWRLRVSRQLLTQ